MKIVLNIIRRCNAHRVNGQTTCKLHYLQGHSNNAVVIERQWCELTMRNWGRTCCGCAAIFRQQEGFFSSNRQSNDSEENCLHEKLIEWNWNGCLHILVPSTCKRFSSAVFLMKFHRRIFEFSNWFKSITIFVSINYRTSNAASSMAREWTDCRWASGAANWWFNRESIDVASSTKVWFKFNIYLSSDKYATCRCERDQLCTGSTL